MEHGIQPDGQMLSDKTIGDVLNQTHLFETSDIQVGELSSSQTVTVVVIKQSLGSWSHIWSLSKVSGCGSTSLFGSRAGTHQGK